MVDLDLAKASANLALHLRDEPMFIRVGVDERNIVVFVACRAAKASTFVPKSFEGYPVVTRASTRVRPTPKRIK